MEDTQRKILLFADWFVPGFKAGGPIRSVANFVAYMQRQYQVFVFTRDRDLDSPEPYKNICINEWLPFGERAFVFYASPGHLSMSSVRKVVAELKPDFIYLNSLFSFKFSIQILLLHKLKVINQKVILAPRGMLRDSALGFKRRKKTVFLKFYRLLKLDKLIYFHATDDTERIDIAKHLGRMSRIWVIPNYPAPFCEFSGIIDKKPGDLSIIFIGRIHPIKNLDFLLELLREVNSFIRLTVVGSEEDKNYTEKCRSLADRLPTNIKVTFLGEKPHEELPAIIQQHHLLALPSKGENFGHAIFESLQQGRPVLISDQTPWRNLELHKAGWELPLNRPDLFNARIEEAAEWDEFQFENWARGAFELAKHSLDTSILQEKYSVLFS